MHLCYNQSLIILGRYRSFSVTFREGLTSLQKEIYYEKGK